MEIEILGRFELLPEVRELHLITGKFDLLVALESEDVDLDPRRQVVEMVVDKVRKLGGIVDTRTIIPIEQQMRPATADRPTVKSFVNPPPQRVANLVETKIGKFQGVRDTDTYVPVDSITKPK